MRFPRSRKLLAGRTRPGGFAAMAAVVLTVLAATVALAGPADAGAPAAKPRTARPQTAAWVTLDASAHTVDIVPIGNSHGSSTLTAHSSFDVGPTAYWIQIWDVTTHTLAQSCSSGTSCAVTITQSSTTTHAYVATVAELSSSYPPAGVQASSDINYVTWQLGIAPYYAASLSGESLDTPPYNSVLTATSSTDVGPTPYYIEIFDVTTGTLLASCGSGTQCVATTSYALSSDSHVAFISGYGTTLLPPNVRAASGSM